MGKMVVCPNCTTENSSEETFCGACCKPMPAAALPSYGPTPAFPYGTSWTRWIRPTSFALLLAVLDEQGVIALGLGLFLALVYLPRSLIAKKFNNCRRERLTRFAIYVVAVILVFGLRVFNTALAKDRAGQIIAAVAQYKKVNGNYPESLDQIVPTFIPEVPSKAKLTLLDNGFRYEGKISGHTLSYVAMPPFGRRIYQFESGKWSDLD